jgi:hypothetical protein
MPKIRRTSVGIAVWLATASFALATLPDADDDGDVDGVDFGVFASCFNKAGNPPRTQGCADPNRFDRDSDGDIDGVDFGFFASCFNGAGKFPRCTVFDVSDENEMLAALQTAQPGDTIRVVVPRIDMPSSYYVPPGVMLTSDGIRENRAIKGNIYYPPGDPDKPVDIVISKLTIGGYIDMYDPTNALVEDCYIDGDIDNTGIRPDHDTYWHLVWEMPVTSSTVRRCEPRNFQRDGFSISHHGTILPDASGATLIVEDCHVDENSNMGLDFNDQPVTTHSYGHLIVRGGYYGGMPGWGAAASGSPYSQIDIYDATFEGGYVEFTYAERCTVINGGAKMHTGHLYDCVFENAGVLEAYGDIEVKRCFIRSKDWDSPTPSTTTGFNLKENADVSIESCVLIGNRRSSSGASRAIVGGGADDSSRSVSITNCLFHNWGWVYNISDTRFLACSLLNNIHLDNVNLVTALSPSVTSGQANYYDQGGSTALLPGGVEFPNGDGADAYDMLDYPNHDFHPLGPANFIKALGAPHPSPIADLDGNWFDPNAPDLGPYVVPQ